MNPENEKYFETYFDLFITDGWSQFISEVYEELNAIKNKLINVDLSYEEVLKERGRLEILNKIFNLENNMRTIYSNSVKEGKLSDNV